MCAARVWPRTPMTASRPLDDAPWSDLRRRSTVHARRSGAAPPSCCRATPRHADARPESQAWTGLPDRRLARGRAGTRGESGGLDSGTSSPTGGAPWRRRTRAWRPRPCRPATARPTTTLLVDLVPMLRRVIGSRVKDPHTVDDLVQETLVRVMAARSTGRAGQAASLRGGHGAQPGRDDGREERPGPQPVAPAGGQPRRASPRSPTCCARRSGRWSAPRWPSCPSGDRDVLMAHEVEGQDTITLAAGQGSTPGAVAARLSRARASLRVEYLLLAEGIEPPTDRCRPVLRALSSGDRRRQRELDVQWSRAGLRRVHAHQGRALRTPRGADDGRRGAGARVEGRRRGRRPPEGPRDRGPGGVLGTPTRRSSRRPSRR